MARKEPELCWKEVRYINRYALFMAYLLMAVRGLGYLVITWSTVVLLGGFVSDLGKDFWSLTIITLVLTPRVSADVGLKEKLMDIRHSFYGLYRAIFGTLNPNDTNDSWPLQLVAGVVWLCHLLLGPIVVCPLAALYVCGPLLSAGISTWRLIQRDYEDNDKKQDGCCNCQEENAHLQPALIVLYSLAILQGLLFCYRFYSSFAQKRIVHDVAKAYKMGRDEEELVMEYLDETVTMCEKDPTFFKETNLATYAVGMIKSESSKSFLSGARILEALLNHQLRVTAIDGLTEEKQKALSVSVTAEKQQALIGLASSSHVLKKLLQGSGLSITVAGIWPRSGMEKRV